MKAVYRYRAGLVSRFLALPLAAFAAACTDSTGPDAALDELLIELVSGHDQTFIRGTVPSEPIRVRITDRDGEGLSGVPVTWTVVEGGGHLPDGGTQVSVVEAVTGEDGLAEVEWRMGFGGWEHALEVSAGTQTRTIEVLAEPFWWRDLLDVRTRHRVIDGELRAQVLLAHEWVAPVELTYHGCLAEAQLYSYGGEAVPEWVGGSCLPGGPNTHPTLAPNLAVSAPSTHIDIDSPFYPWRVDIADLEPGIYAIVIRFNETIEVNGRRADLDDTAIIHVVE